jgi:phosphoribosyl-AMP cyclohydrolase / phosphoribosyl-ATP pyrophosphohydrolase
MVEALIQGVRFDERGLIPAVVQDASTSDIIALCYMDAASLAKTLQTGQAELNSASLIGKPRRLVDVRINADGSSLTVVVEPGEQSNPAASSILEKRIETQHPELSLVDVPSMEFGLAINNLYALIARRKEERPQGSYTTYLFDSGLDKILKKIAEESGEVIIAAKNKSSREIISELSDLFYHLLVLMVERGVKLDEVREELRSRAAPKEKTERSGD